MMKRAILVPVLVLLLAGCGATAQTTTPSVPPAPVETYGDCVDGITMDPNDPQAYIDEVAATCGHLDES